MNLLARSLTSLAGLALLACGAAASAKELRFACNDHPGMTCNPRNAATSTTIAIDVASSMSANVGDSVLILKNNQNGSYSTQLTRYFSVISTPVDSASDFIIDDYESDTYDGALPTLPGLRNENGDAWEAYLPMPGTVVYCCGQ
ncbi:hypothetical protein DFR29_116169 [Tahibacter aquaticus]|jgi:hypothetical protein|uniref:Uncharacterized protein n=1 Tax=Tahibacter aquaticus TaxID=520092 RepID=A0A4R6YP61_9GAMM|nr:hypothetical protein [Tahibacter aquaticus]TDR39465.1 hypothetical protein DFR29_116169 [Tahibacter aquaticus]